MMWEIGGGGGGPSKPGGGPGAPVGPAGPLAGGGFRPAWLPVNRPVPVPPVPDPIPPPPWSPLTYKLTATDILWSNDGTNAPGAEVIATVDGVLPLQVGSIVALADHLPMGLVSESDFPTTGVGKVVAVNVILKALEARVQVVITWE